MIRLIYDNVLAEADLAQAVDGGIGEGDEILTALIVSLFTDRLADEGEVREGLDRAGWWGDAFDDDGDRIGSKLWILQTERDLPGAPARAERWAIEAIQWMVEDGIARSVRTSAVRVESGHLALAVSVLPTVGAERRYDFEV